MRAVFILAGEPVPWGVSVGIGALLVASGLLVWVVAARGASGKMGRNYFAGIRTPSTLRSDEAWLAAHKAGQGPTKVAAIVSVLTGLLLMALRPEGAGFAVILIGGAVAMVALVIYGAVVGSRSAKAISDSQA